MYKITAIWWREKNMKKWIIIRNEMCYNFSCRDNFFNCKIIPYRALYGKLENLDRIDSFLEEINYNNLSKNITSE